MKLRIVALSLLISFTLSAQEFHSNRNGMRLAFYNLENLFDTENDSLKRDDDFTPKGKYNWSEYRYQEKSNRMAKVMLAIGGWEPPEIIGVCEIENRKVLDDLVQGRVLKKFGYDIVHYESDDWRGIDVALLYRNESFTPIYSYNYKVKLASKPNFKTRDVLYVKGYLKGLDTIHIMVNHWPSRYGGQAKSEPNRIAAALTVRHIVDSIQGHQAEANVIVMGDLNDEWDNISVKDSLAARRISESKGNDLVNLMASLDPNQGSHRYRGNWSYLDQIIVSKSLLDSQSTDVDQQSAFVFREKFLLEEDNRYPGLMPFRMFLGLRYNFGFSDHLPVYIDLVNVK